MNLLDQNIMEHILDSRSFFPKKRPMKTSWNPKCAQGLQGAPNGWLLPFQTCTKWQGSLGVKHVVQKQWRVSLR